MLSGFGRVAAAVALAALVSSPTYGGVAASAATTAAPPLVWAKRAPVSPIIKAGSTFVFETEADDSDHANQVTAFDVRLSRTSMTATRRAAWAYPAAQQGVPSGATAGQVWVDHRVPLRQAQGQVLCVSARAHDTDGNVGAWSEAVCSIRFLDDSRLQRTGHVVRLSNSHFWNGRASSIRSGGSLVLPHVPAGSSVIPLWTDEAMNTGWSRIRITYRGKHHLVDNCSVGTTTGRHRYYGESAGCATRPRRMGPVTFRQERSAPSAPLEGIAIVPTWR